MSEREPTEKEKREAEALARALDGEGPVEGVPDDALEAAALLRSSLPEAELSPERSEQILGEVLEGLAKDGPARSCLTPPPPGGARFAARRRGAPRRLRGPRLEHPVAQPTQTKLPVAASLPSSEGERVVKQGRAPVSWLRWLAPAAALAAAAGVALLVVTMPLAKRAPPPVAAQQPGPPRDLLLAQAKAARGEGLEDLVESMRLYRSRMLAELADRYREGK